VKAIVQTGYGPPDVVLELRDLERPGPGPDAVLVRVHTAAVNPADWHVVRGIPLIVRPMFGLFKPRVPVPGSDLAGTVEAVGANVTALKRGDEVVGHCFGGGSGAFAEYAVVPSDRVVLKPEALSFDDAAALPLAGVTALRALRDRGRLQRGQRVLIVGASGGIGSFAVQLAVEMGADVTGVCSAANLDLVRSLGATKVVDYSTTDIARIPGGYDLIVQLGGTDSIARLRPLLTRTGTIVLAGGESSGRWVGPVGRFVRAVVVSTFVRQRFVTLDAKPRVDDMTYLVDLAASGRLRSVVSATYALAEVPKAIAQIESAHTRGKIIVRIGRGHSRPRAPRPRVG
jgi:NADPH:quinone reductase-like Zn-dependent oxidoreductase